MQVLMPPMVDIRQSVRSQGSPEKASLITHPFQQMALRSDQPRSVGRHQRPARPSPDKPRRRANTAAFRRSPTAASRHQESPSTRRRPKESIVRRSSQHLARIGPRRRLGEKHGGAACTWGRCRPRRGGEDAGQMGNRAAKTKGNHDRPHAIVKLGARHGRGVVRGLSAHLGASSMRVA